MGFKFIYASFDTCFGRSTQGAGTRCQPTTQIPILRHLKKKGGHGLIDWLAYVYICNTKHLALASEFEVPATLIYFDLKIFSPHTNLINNVVVH